MRARCAALPPNSFDAGPPLTAILRAGDAAQRLAWRRYWIRDPLFGLMDYALHWGMRIGTIGSCSATGHWLGVLAGRWRFKAWDQRARATIARLKPEAGQGAALDPLMDRMWGQIGRVMAEFSVLDRLWARGRITVEGAEHVTAPRAEGRPVLVMGVHVANWEVIAPSLTRLGHPPFFIYQPPRNRFQHRIAVRMRTRCGATMLRPDRTGTRRAWRALVEDRNLLLMFVDELKDGRIAAPSFGRPLRSRGNLANVVRLAQASGATVVPAHAERHGATRFRVVFHPPATLAPDDGSEATLLENVRRLDALVTPIVLAHLEDWFMLHDFRFDR